MSEFNPSVDIQNIAGLVEKLSFYTNQLGTPYNNKKGDEIGLKGFVYLDLMQRINANLEALKYLFRQLEHAEELKYSIALLLRTCLSDTLTGYYLWTFLNDEKSFENETKLLGVDYAIYVKFMAENEPLFNTVEENKEVIIKNKRKEVYESFIELFKETDINDVKLSPKKPEEVRESSNDQIFIYEGERMKQLTDKAKYERLKRKDDTFSVSYIYVLIRFFSQYHHYGFYNRQVLSIDLNEIFPFLAQSLSHICGGIHTFGTAINANEIILKDVELLISEFQKFDR